MEEQPTIRYNTKQNGIEISHKTKPSDSVLTWLKSNKYRWAKFNKCWYKKFNQEAWEEVHNFFGVDITSVMPIIERMPDSEAMADKYISMIRNPLKKVYAMAYRKWIKDGKPEGKEPEYQGKSYMAGQDVRFTLLKFYPEPETPEEEANKARPSHWITPHTTRYEINKKLIEKHPSATQESLNKQFELGYQIEKEHIGESDNTGEPLRIAYDHLWEDPEYYTKAKPKDWAEKELEKETELPEPVKQPNSLPELLLLYNMQTDDFDKRQVIDNFTYRLAGDRNKKVRQILMEKLTGEKLPVAKCGIHAIEAELKKYMERQGGEPKKEFFRETSIYDPPKKPKAEPETPKQSEVGKVRPEFMREINNPLLIGREIQISMPNGEKHKAVFAIVELDNIIASHNEENFHSEPLYPKNAAGNNINDRNYKDDISAQKAVMDYAKDLEPERLITTSRTPSGTPIITTDGFVVSGNNRTMSMKLAKSKYPDNYKEYVKYLSEEIEAYGLSNQLGAFSHPALVRIDYDFKEYTTQELSKYNKDTKKSERPVDKAIKLSNILRENTRCADIIAEITGEYETFSEFYVNVPGQKKLAKTLVECNLLTSQELPAYFSETTFTEQGKEFVENLLAALILDREALLATEQPGVKATRQKLITSLPVLMKNASLPEGSLKKEINDAVILQQIIKTSGSEFPDFIRQRNLFGTKYDRKTVYLNSLISMGKFKFKQAIEGYNDAILKNQGASLFGEKPSNDEIFDHWIKGNTSETDQRLIEASDIVSRGEEPIQKLEEPAEPNVINIESANIASEELKNVCDSADIENVTIIAEVEPDLVPLYESYGFEKIA